MPRKYNLIALDDLYRYSPSTYGPFSLRWVGWKLSDESEYAVGQWVAHEAGISGEKPKHYWYASYPGGQGAYERGVACDVSARDGQGLVSHDDLYTNPRYDEYKQECLERLLDVLDSVEIQPHS